MKTANTLALSNSDLPVEYRENNALVLDSESDSEEEEGESESDVEMRDAGSGKIIKFRGIEMDENDSSGDDEILGGEISNQMTGKYKR